MNGILINWHKNQLIQACFFFLGKPRLLFVDFLDLNL